MSTMAPFHTKAAMAARATDRGLVLHRSGSDDGRSLLAFSHRSGYGRSRHLAKSRFASVGMCCPH